MFPVPLLLCYAGLIFCFHYTPSIHLKGGKPPTTNRIRPASSWAQHCVFLHSHACTQGARAYTHTQKHISIGDRFCQTLRCSSTEKGLMCWQLAPPDLRSHRPPPVPFLQYEKHILSIVSSTFASLSASVLKRRTMSCAARMKRGASGECRPRCRRQKIKSSSAA